MKKLLMLLAFTGCLILTKASNWTIVGANQTFTLDSITISYGDTITFQIDSADNAQEVSRSTWLANDSVPVTGFQTAQGGGLVTGLTPGAHYYVSDSSASLGMKGFIDVLPPATVQFAITSDSVLETVDSIPVIISVVNPSGEPVTYTLTVNVTASTAVSGNDYIFSNVTFTDTGTTSSDTVYITLIDNPVIQPIKTVVFNLVDLSSNSLVGADSAYTLYIINNDTLTFSFLGAAFSYPQTVDTAYIGITKSSPVPYNDSVIVVLDTGNAVKGVNFYCADTIIVYFPADSVLSALDSLDTIYFPVLIFFDAIPVGNTQVNFRLLPPPGNTLLGISAYTLFIIGEGVNGVATPLATDNDLKLFPNPVNSSLNIVTGVSWQMVQITDLVGNEVISIGELTSGNRQLDLSALPSGVYMVDFQNSQSRFSRKFVKILAP